MTRQQQQLQSSASSTTILLVQVILQHHVCLHFGRQDELQRLEDQCARNGGGIEPSECVERVMESQEFVQAVTSHLQCLDTFQSNAKQGVFHELQAATREIARWYPRFRAHGMSRRRWRLQR